MTDKYFPLFGMFDSLDHVNSETIGYAFVAIDSAITTVNTRTVHWTDIVSVFIIHLFVKTKNDFFCAGAEQD